MQEWFDYDVLNRVTSATIGATTKTFGYNAIGNLTSRTGVGTYTYPASGATSVRPHAVSSIAGTVDGIVNPALSYDANGNTLTGIGRTTTWTAANLPASVSRTNAVTGTSVNASFVYGAEHQRIKQTLSNGVTLFYAEGIEKEINATGTRVKTYLPGNIGYIEETTASPTPTTRYFHEDHLGSVIAISDANRNVIERLSYDVWGQRRNANGTDDTSYALKSAQDRTGYTGQEHLEELDLIHMNGRVYDPIIGRFTSADPTIPDPTDHQAFNRYSYVLNNPLAYTDPTGFESQSDTGQTGFSKTLGFEVYGYHVEGGSDSASEPRSPMEKESQNTQNNDTVRRLVDPTQRPAALADSFNSNVDQIPGPDGKPVPASERPAYKPTIWDKVASFLEEVLYRAQAIPGESMVLAGVSKVTRTATAAEEAAQAAKGIAAETTTVIGRVKDLKSLPAGEKSLLDRLPNLGDPKANWAQNSGVLRQEMGRGLPIRDASPLDVTGQFLNAERNLLRDRGWTFDRATNYWTPPKP